MQLYTEDQAREILPEVIRIVEELREAFLELRALQAAVATEARGASGDGNLIANPWEKREGHNRAEALNRQLQGTAAQLTQLGIEVKDPERGLIDFHSEREGRVVFLCYLLGEPDLMYWHEVDAGFAGRQRL